MSFSSYFVNLIFPRRCPICDEVIPPRLLLQSGGSDRLICKSCQNIPARLKEPLCMKCGKPLSDETAQYCPDCQKSSHIFQKNFALFKYRSISGAIYRFKYMGRQEYGDYFAKEGARMLSEKISRIAPDALVPVPMYPGKEKKRGYNQAEVFARKLGKRLHIPVRNDLVKRVTDTIPQKELGSAARRRNLKGAFNIIRNDVSLKSIIIIDDIYTTGSTLDAVALVLRRAGVSEVYCITIAIGQMA